MRSNDPPKKYIADCHLRSLQDPKKRATADEILRHSWMKENGTASDKPLDNVILTRMRGFMNMNKLKKEALKVIAGGMSPEEIAGLRSLFQVSFTPPPCTEVAVLPPACSLGLPYLSSLLYRTWCSPLSWELCGDAPRLCWMYMQ